MKILPNEPFFEKINEIILSGQSVELKVKGGSMRPFLREIGRAHV